MRGPTVDLQTKTCSQWAERNDMSMGYEGNGTTSKRKGTDDEKGLRAKAKLKSSVYHQGMTTGKFLSILVLGPSSRGKTVPKILSQMRVCLP